LAHARSRRNPGLIGHFKAVQAQVAGAPLEQRHAQRQAQRARQPRQITAEQLVLQRLGGGGQQHPLA
jgi:hypothetical protein